jgi:hypothetical protein
MKMKAIFVIMLLGYGCTAKRLAVQNADTLINYQINKRLPLNSDQRDQLNRDVENFLNKEKTVAQEILPVIDEIDLKTSEKVESQYKKLEDFFLRISKDFTVYVAKYLAKLNNTSKHRILSQWQKLEPLYLQEPKISLRKKGTNND